MTFEKLTTMHEFVLDGYYYVVISVDEDEQVLFARCSDNGGEYEFSWQELGTEVGLTWN